MDQSLRITTLMARFGYAIEKGALLLKREKGALLLKKYVFRLEFSGN